MTVQIAALIFIGLWIFWGAYYRIGGRGHIALAIAFGLGGAFFTSTIILVAGFVLSAAGGCFS